MADSRVGHNRTAVLRDRIQGLQVFTTGTVQHSRCPLYCSRSNSSFALQDQVNSVLSTASVEAQVFEVR